MNLDDEPGINEKIKEKKTKQKREIKTIIY